ncbi:MAG: hypothetical protein QNK36_05615 [Colwellia sp.]|nr:hypothetical protein [Colwellia sp.]
MDSKQLIGFLILSATSGYTFAACTGAPLNQPALTTLLPGKTVCASFGGEQWQELHTGAGSLIDYKKGPVDPVDPSENVGSWSVSGNTVTYNYGSGGSYSYRIFDNGGTYSFCGISPAPTEIVATLQTASKCL